MEIGILNAFLELAGESVNSNAKFIIKSRNRRRRKRFIAAYTFRYNKITRKVPKCKDFLGSIKEMPNDVFYSHFRMEIQTFENVCEIMRKVWPKPKTGRPNVKLEHALYITLWKLGNQNSFREISNRFNTGQGAVYRVFVKTVKLLAKLKNVVIKFPTTESQRKMTMEKFESLRSHPFPYVLGCIDGTHIRISQPTKSSISFYNRKGTFSIIAQAVVDSDMRFIDVFVGYPGRCHDASVWQSSPLCRAITNQLICFPPECHLLGDSAYPLEAFLMVPYKDNGFLSAEKGRFNSILSSTRVCVEQAFGILKKKFRMLNYIEIRNIELVKHVIISCMVLHNVILSNEGASIAVIDPAEASSEDATLSTTAARNEARIKRDQLANLLSA